MNNETLLALQSISDKVNANLLTIYRTYIEDSDQMSDALIIQKLVEGRLIKKETENEKDLVEAAVLCRKLFFNDIAEWVDYQMRQDLEPVFRTCRNCMYRQSNDFCALNNCMINPNFYDKDCFTMGRDIK